MQYPRGTPLKRETVAPSFSSYDLELSCGIVFAGQFSYYGTPQSLDPDEHIFIRKAMSMLALKSADPGWYGATAQSLMYILALGYFPQWLV